MAEGAGAEPAAVFAAGIEELSGEGGTEGRCTDLVACPPATADGHLWVAHNNDLDPGSRTIWSRSSGTSRAIPWC